MLDNRDYMRNRRTPQEDNGHSGIKCLFAIICINILVFIAIPGNSKILNQFALSPAMFKEGCYWTPLTAMFFHADGWHLFFNMFSLYIFGSLVAPVLGWKRFLALFLFSGVIGNALWTMAAWNTYTYLIGASGAVTGIIMASAMILPNVEMFLLFVPFPMKLKTLAVVFILLELFMSSTAGTNSGVAYLAHVGGFLGGYIFMKLFLKQIISWDIMDYFRTKPKRPSTETKYPGWTVSDPKYSPPRKQPDENHSAASGGSRGGKITQGEIDRLLDKISRHGINSLTEEELDSLRRAREQMRGGM